LIPARVSSPLSDDSPRLSPEAVLATAPASFSARPIWVMVAVLIVLDQLSKWIVISSMDLYQSVPIIGNWLRLTHIRNSGGAFGLRWGHVAVYYASAAIVILWIVRHLLRDGRSRRLSVWALALILTGAIGNLIDRIMRGEVVDFIDAEFFDLRVPAFNLGILRHPGFDLDRWPTFNIADSAVTVGVIVLLVSLWWDPIVARRRQTTPPASPSVS
jgi:signal peptidase II